MPTLRPRLPSWLILAIFTSAPLQAAENGLLFHLTGEHGTTADISAAGTPRPTYERGITRIADGAVGGALQCADTQLLAYRAPGNIHAQRGTLAFHWRSRHPVGPTEFPVFRVAYADHSSWDMVWLRIDYNGRGFDAFVTDASLARTRVSATVAPFPNPATWTHIAFAWDETRGVRLYINGLIAGRVDTTARYDAALDQFGPHSRIISPYQVQSDYNFMRGGDIDDVRIYDRMLDDGQVAALAKGDSLPRLAVLPARNLADAATRQEWWHRHGWDSGIPPPHYPGTALAVRKVEIHDAFDLQRWWWKATDGIRETTWPGVYNRSRLPGRNDYFQLPDWDCYVESGRAITFSLPGERWNHVEISGSAHGTMTLAGPDGESALFTRPGGREKTVHAVAGRNIGGKLTFTNAEAEEPIGELGVYHVSPGRAPEGITSLGFT
ncbi:MAG: LamG-like jellyroll fold domain-containing protein, partial [Opitutus sp.]